MIRKVISSIFKKALFLQIERDLLQKLWENSDERYQHLFSFQERNVMGVLRSEDGRIIKIQYGKNRAITEQKFGFHLLQKESVVARFTFSIGEERCNFVQIFQINGLISAFEYRYPPDLKSGDVINLLRCETYLRSRDPIDPVEIVSRLQGYLNLSNFTITDLDPPGTSSEIAGSKASFPEILDDYFALCSLSDGFNINKWEFLGLKFRQVKIETNFKNYAFILAQRGYRECIALIDDLEMEWNLYKARLDLENLSIVKEDLLPYNFQLAFTELISSPEAD